MLGVEHALELRWVRHRPPVRRVHASGDRVPDAADLDLGRYNYKIWVSQDAIKPEIW